MDDKIWEDFMEYLRYLITSGEVNGIIHEQYKPVVVAYFFDAEVYGDGIQSFFEIYSFSLDDVLQAFQILEVSPELIQVIKEANEHNYITNDELYDQEPDSEDKFEELMEERDLFWDNINHKYCGIENNDIEEKIIDYIKTKIEKRL